MNLNDFKDIVRDSTLKLIEYGYRILTESSAYASPYSIELEKVIAMGVICVIRFQPIHVPEVDMFQVILIRRRMENFTAANITLKPLYIDLPNLMLGIYKKDIFPPRQYAWKFSSETDLEEQISNAQSLVIDYGIKWLEDAMSSIDWVQRRNNSTSS